MTPAPRLHPFGGVGLSAIAIHPRGFMQLTDSMAAFNTIQAGQASQAGLSAYALADTAAAAQTAEAAQSTISLAAAGEAASSGLTVSDAATTGAATVSSGFILGYSLATVAVVSGAVALVGVGAYVAYRTDTFGLRTRLHRQVTPQGWLPADATHILLALPAAAESLELEEIGEVDWDALVLECTTV